MKGFTLIEVVVSIGIFIIIVGAVGLFESNIFSYQRSVSGTFINVEDAEVAIKAFSHDLRMAGGGSDGSYALQIVATDTLEFFADLKGDGLKERVRYSLVGNDLYRSVLTPTGSPLSYSGMESTSTILADVKNASSNPVFSYFDGTYTGTSTGIGEATGALLQPVSPGDVRLIQINLFFNSRTYTDDVALRNLKDNL